MIKKYNITVNGSTYQVEVEEIKENFKTNHIPNQSYSPNKDTSSTINNLSIQNNTNKIEKSIVAPMPGTINSISVSVGESVSKGQILLILEAMKMENEIVASKDGVVKSINVSKGSSVNAGDILIDIE